MKDFTRQDLILQFGDKILKQSIDAANSVNELKTAKSRRDLIVGIWQSEVIDLMCDAVKWDRTQRPIYGQWYSINNYPYADKEDMDNALLKFDNGDICKSTDDYPFALITHILFFPNPNKLKADE